MKRDWTNHASRFNRRELGERLIHYLSRFTLNEAKVLLAFEAFGVDFVDVFGAGGAGGEPAVFGAHFEAADGRAVGGRVGELGDDGFASERFSFHLIGRKGGQLGFFFAGGRGVDAIIDRVAELGDELLVVLARILAGDGQNFAGQQAKDDTVLVGGPNRAVLAQERCPGGFFAAETVGAIDEPVDEPFEADRNLLQRTAEIGGNAVDH